MTHETVQELLGAYGLDAVDADETSTIEAHLQQCPRCRSEVEVLRHTATWLAYEGGEAPVGLWDRISASLSEPAPPLRLHFHGRRYAGRGRRLLTVAAVAIVGAVAVAAGVFGLRHAASQDPAAALAVRAASALNTPGVRLARLTGLSGEAATAVVRADGHGYFLASSLRPLDHRIYQLWGATASGQVASLGTVTGPGTYAIAVPADVHVVMVTIEDRAEAAPTSASIVTGPLT